MTARSGPTGIELDHFEATLGGELHSEGVRVALGVADFLDARVHDHLHAQEARLVGAVERGSSYRDAVVGSLDDGVLLGVQRALAALTAVHDPDEAPHVLAVRHPRRAAVVASREDAFVQDDDRADREPRARRARGYLVRNAHEVLVPRRALLLECGVLLRGVHARPLKGFHTTCLLRRRGPAR